jgi:mono/diheme cytochrome c family protein
MGTLPVIPSPARDLLFVITVAILAAVGCRPHADAREARDFERMRLQQRYDAYGRSRFFANGAVLQPPPSHTMARPAAFSSTDSVRPLAFFSGHADSGFSTTIPIAVDNRLRAIGARQFAVSCAPCHGAGGFGGGPIAANLVNKRPPSLRPQTTDTLPVGLIFSIITDGFGVMPPYGWQMPPEARWAIVGYVRSLAGQPSTALTTADSVQAASLRRIDSLHATGMSLRELMKRTQAP